MQIGRWQRDTTVLPGKHDLTTASMAGSTVSTHKPQPLHPTCLHRSQHLSGTDRILAGGFGLLQHHLLCHPHLLLKAWKTVGHFLCFHIRGNLLILNLGTENKCIPTGAASLSLCTNTVSLLALGGSRIKNKGA